MPTEEEEVASAEVEEFTARFEREFSPCVGHVDRERASIITSAEIEIEREYFLLIGHLMQGHRGMTAM